MKNFTLIVMLFLQFSSSGEGIDTLNVDSKNTDVTIFFSVVQVINLGVE